MDDFKFNILGMSMKKGDVCRLVVEGNKAMYEAWLKRINEDWPAPLDLDEALECSEYVSGYSKEKDAYYVWFEIEICRLTCSNEIHVIYFFDEYEELNVELSEEEKEACITFINTWADKVPDNNVAKLGDGEWLETIPDDIPWKKNLR